MKLREPSTVLQHQLFVSSADEDLTRRLRQRVKRLVEDVINPQLLNYPEGRVTLALRLWEREAAQKAEPNENVNEIFVRYARESSLTIVLLIDEIRPGTMEELVAALGDDDVDLAVLIFE